MIRFSDLDEDEKERQRAIAADLMGNGAFADKEGIDIFLELESPYDGADKIDIPSMTEAKYGKAPSKTQSLSTSDIKKNNNTYEETQRQLLFAEATAAALFGTPPPKIDKFPENFSIKNTNFNVVHEQMPFGTQGQTAFDIFSDLSKIFHSSKGNELLNAYNNRGYLLPNDNFTIALNNRGIQRAVPHSNYVVIDPIHTPRIKTETGYEKVNQLRLLSHELPHAMVGTGDAALLRPGPTIENYENPIMKQLGYPPRLYY